MLRPALDPVARARTALGARLSARIAALLVAALQLASAGGCVVHQGDGWTRSFDDRGGGGQTRTRDDAGVSLIVIGAPAPGLTARQVARHLDATIREERGSGRGVVLIWPGDNVFPAGLGDGADCLEVEAAWTRPGVRDLAEVVASARARGDLVGSYGGLGRRDWACHAPEAQFGAVGTAGATGGQPYLVPDHHYLVRIHRDGTSSIASTCVGDTCQVAAADPERPAALELLVVDQTPWVFPPAEDAPAGTRSRAERVNARLDAMLAALRALDEVAPPTTRVLVSHVAVESAGMHGQGGLRPAATVHRLHPAVRDAVTEGRVRGVLASLDRSLQLLPDLDPAVQRVAKIWIERPVFQVVAGAAGRPDARAPGSRRQFFWNQGIGAVPEYYSTLPGLGLVRVDPETIDLELHALRAGRWERARSSVPVNVDPLPVAREAPPMTPCPRCDPRQAPANR